MENRISAVVSRVIAARLAVGVGLCATTMGFAAAALPTYSFASNSVDLSSSQLPPVRENLTKEQAEQMAGCEAEVKDENGVNYIVIKPKGNAAEGIISADLKPDDFKAIQNQLSGTTLKFEGNVHGYGNISALFSNTHIESLGNIGDFDVSNVTDMSYMFRGCNYLKSLDGLEKWNTKNVTTMRGMFGGFLNREVGKYAGCESLANVDALEKWDVSNVTDMSYMFSGCTSLKSLKGLKNWNTHKVKDMSYMFGGQLGNISPINQRLGNIDGCKDLANVNALEKWDVSNVTDMSHMFSGCTSLKSLDGLKNWNTQNVVTMQRMFAGQAYDDDVKIESCKNLTNVNALKNWNVSNVTDMSYLFFGCENLTDISGLAEWNTGKVGTMKRMFSGYIDGSSTSNGIGPCEKLTNLEALKKWNTAKVTDMSFMFNGCKGLTSLEGLNDWKTDSLTTMQGMFGWHISVSYYKKSINANRIGFQNLKDISALSKWDTSKVTDMSYLFYGCKMLTNLQSLAKWNTSNVASMREIFGGSPDPSLSTWPNVVPGCEGLTNLSGLEKWDTGKVTDMAYMFFGCKNLENLAALKDWNTGNATTMEAMFGGSMAVPGCEKLKNVDDIAGWNVRNVTNMEAMFSLCKALKNLNGLKNWITNKPVKIPYMFIYCENLIDISGLHKWNVDYDPNQMTLYRAFSGCKRLSDISPIEHWANNFQSDKEGLSSDYWMFSHRKRGDALLTFNNKNWFKLDNLCGILYEAKESAYIFNVGNETDDATKRYFNDVLKTPEGGLMIDLMANLVMTDNGDLITSMKGIKAENDNYHVLKVTYKGASETSHMPSVLDSRINGKDAKPSSDPFEIVKHYLPSIVAGGAGDLPNKNEQPSNYLALADHKLLTSEELSAKGNDDPNAKLMQLFQQYTIKPARDVQFMSEGKEVATIKGPLDGTIGELANETVVTKDAVLTGVTMPKEPVKEGYIFKEWNTKPDGSGETFTSSTIIKGDGSKPLVVYAIFIRPTDPEVTALYRLYNPYTHEHFFTAETVENDNLVRLGWKSEGGVGYIYKHGEKGGVYRLYNPSTGEHHYTMKEDEVAKCVKAGWKNEGVKWFSAQNKEVTLNKLYSMYNPYEKKFYHHYTADAKEIEQMVKAGWRKEEVKWCTLPLTYNAK